MLVRVGGSMAPRVRMTSEPCCNMKNMRRSECLASHVVRAWLWLMLRGTSSACWLLSVELLCFL